MRLAKWRRWRKSYQRIKGITPQEVNRLEQARLDRQQLVDAAMADKPLADTSLLLDGFVSCSDSGLETLSSITNIPQERMAELLRDSELQSSKSWTELLRDSVSPSSTSQAKPFHWADALVAGATVLILLSLIVPALRNLMGSKKELPAAAPQAIASADIPAFTTIRPKDISVKNVLSPAQGNDFARDFIGHYAVSAIRKGDPVSPDVLSKKAVDLSGLQTLQIDVKSAPPLAGRTLPQEVDVLLSPRQQPGEGAKISGLLLALSSSAGSTTATLAIPPASIAEGVKWFASCDAYLSFPVSTLGVSGIDARQGAAH